MDTQRQVTDDLSQLVKIDYAAVTACLVLSTGKTYDNEITEAALNVKACHPMEYMLAEIAYMYNDLNVNHEKIIFCVASYTGDIVDLLRELCGEDISMDRHRQLLEIACTLCKTEMDVYEVCIYFKTDDRVCIGEIASALLSIIPMSDNLYKRLLMRLK